VETGLMTSHEILPYWNSTYYIIIENSQGLFYKTPHHLHFELWENQPINTHRNYLGGNWFAEEKPENLMNPTRLLKSLCRKYCCKFPNILSVIGIFMNKADDRISAMSDNIKSLERFPVIKGYYLVIGGGKIGTDFLQYARRMVFLLCL
jgi:hypothetical protein